VMPPRVTHPGPMTHVGAILGPEEPGDCRMGCGDVVREMSRVDIEDLADLPNVQYCYGSSDICWKSR
jgi:hypothetical protein